MKRDSPTLTRYVVYYWAVLWTLFGAFMFVLPGAFFSAYQVDLDKLAAPDLRLLLSKWWGMTMIGCGGACYAIASFGTYLAQRRLLQYAAIPVCVLGLYNTKLTRDFQAAHNSGTIMVNFLFLHSIFNLALCLGVLYAIPRAPLDTKKT